MNNLCWEVFKRTGSVEAYLYITNSKELNKSNDNMNREIKIDYDNCEHPGDSATISKI